MVKIANNFSVCLGVYCVPKFALYIRIQKADKRKNIRSKWAIVENVSACATKKCFPVIIVEDGEKIGNRIYVSERVDYARELKMFARSIGNLPECVQNINSWNISSVGPKSKKTDEYLLPFNGDIRYQTERAYRCEERSVSDGCVIGQRRLTENGYNKERLNIPAPDYRILKELCK